VTDSTTALVDLTVLAPAPTGPSERPGADRAKRMVDLVVGTALLVGVLPLIAVLALGSAIALRAWPFFVQERIGRDGRSFHFVKIRTLPPATGAYVDKYALADVPIPAFTRALRALHLDELPQLLLVVLGQMSLVGPRPEMPALDAQLPRSLARARNLVRPGCTGLWQVGEHCDRLIGEAPGYDLFYVQHRTLRLDLWILGQTVRKVVRGGHGIVRLDEVPAWARRDRAAEPRDVVIDLTDRFAPDLVLQALEA
jgi:lipopolysaccharide/colanic/teichoic acid biosynthesis glycosyltransferase